MGTSFSEQLLKVLNKIDRPGTFSASGVLPSILPGLEVSDLGPIALPLEKRQAAALKKQSRQAPYGKGTQTVVDTSIRRVWEVDAEKVTFANPEWAGVVQKAVEVVQSELGLLKQKLQPHLYKMLVYETGSFFLAHRDGEKLDRMVATLVIVLPSAHEGGELIVRHEGREVIIDFGAKSRFQTQFAAFYADCEHEVRPVTSGFRLALVYNLTLAKGKESIVAPTSGEHIAAVSNLLRNWVAAEKKAAAKDEPAPPKLAVLLDHKYSQAGLIRDTLKGVDAAQADVLFAAARDAGCDASLALVTYWESGLAEPDGGYDFGRRGWHDDDDSEDDGDYIMQEVYDHSLKAEHFSDPEGAPLAFGWIPFDEEEIVSKEPLNERDADEQDFEGYTGNAGMTLERWYHRAAVVIWPEEKRFDVLCEAGVETAVGGLAQMVRRWKKVGKKEGEPLKQSCLDFAGRIIARWPECSARGRQYSESSAWDDDDDFDDDVMCDGVDVVDIGDTAYTSAAPDDGDGNLKDRPSPSLVSLLNTLGDATLVSAWIRGVLARDPSVYPGTALGRCCKHQGWLIFQEELGELIEDTSNETLERDAALLADFASYKDKDVDRIALCSHLAGLLMNAVERWSPPTGQSDWRARRVHLPRLLSSLTQSFLAIDEPDQLARLVAYVLDRPKEFDLTTTQVPAWIDLENWLRQHVKVRVAPVGQWLGAMIDTLEMRAAQPPQEPTDWRRSSDIGCICADCKVLAAFLDNPKEATFRFPLAEARRRHLHERVKHKALDTTHATERKGRPYTLVFKKTKASYQRALAAHRLDLDHLAKMRKLLEWHNGLKAEHGQSGAAKPKAKARPKAKAKTKAKAKKE